MTRQTPTPSAEPGTADRLPCSDPLRQRRPFWTRDWGLLFLIAFLVFSAGLGCKDPWPPDEPRFALVAKEMVESGEWLFPHRAAELYPDKPPLFLWTVALFYWLTGSLRLAHLLPALLAGLGVLLLVYDLGRRLWNRRVGWWAGVALLAIFQFPLQARSGQIDGFLVLWTTLGLYGLARHLLRGPAWGWYFGGWFAMGLGVITKGVGFLPLLILIPYAFARRRGWRGLSWPGLSWPGLSWPGLSWRGLPMPAPERRKLWLGPLFLLLAVALWLVPMVIAVELRGDPDLVAYRQNILWRQTAVRYADPWGHFAPFWFYVLNRIPALWFPLAWLLPWLLPAWKRRFARHDSRFLLLLGWLVLVVFFFSLSTGKRGVYLLPATPALALAAAPLLPGVLRRPAVQRLAFGCLAGFTALLVGVAAVAWLGPPAWTQQLDAQVGAAAAPAAAPWLSCLAFAAVAWTFWAWPRKGSAGLAGWLVTFWLLYGWWGQALLNPVRSASELMARVRSALGPRAELALVGFKEQFVLQADRPIIHFGYGTPPAVAAREAAAWLTQGETSRWVLLPEASLVPCFAPERTVLVGPELRDRWHLVDAQALTLACRTPPPQLVGGPAELRVFRYNPNPDRRAPDRRAPDRTP